MTLLRALVALGLAAQAAPQGPVPDLMAPQSLSRRMTPEGAPSWTLLWRQPTVRTGHHRQIRESFGQPAISERHKRIIVATAEGVVIAYGLDTASEQWRYVYGSALETTAYLVAVGGELAGRELVILGTRNNTLLALDVQSGGLVWQTDIDGELRAAPRLAEGVLVTTTSANKVSIIEPATGQVVWSHGRPAPTGLSVEGHARASVADGRVFVSFSDGFGAAFSLKDGELLWGRPLSLRGGSFVDADADPVVYHDRVMMASYSDGIYALDVADGQTRWNQPAQAVSTLSLAADRLLAGSADGWVASLDARDGRVQWRTFVAGTPLSRLVTQAHEVFLTAGESGLISLELEHGKAKQASTVHERLANDMAVSERHLAFVSASGHLYVWQRAQANDAARDAFARRRLGR